jgi:hypothetical protein
MALVEKLSKITMDRNAVHEPVTDATFAVFQDDEGRSFLQIDTYGSYGRKYVGKKSQSLQFGPDALKQLRAILDGLPTDR